MMKSDFKLIPSLLHAAQIRQQAMLDQLETLVLTESPTDDKAAVDRVGILVADWLHALDGKIRWHRQKEFGDLLEVRFHASGSAPHSGHAKKKPVLLLGHLDTVWPAGTLATMPFRVAKGRAYGPGIYDMKAGVVMAIHALAMLRETGGLNTPVTFLLNSEEEVGSPRSRAITEKLAQQCSSVFVLEPSLGPRGAYKTARKGVGEYVVRVQGVAAHSGVDFEKGHSAILELARLLGKISGFTNRQIGLTVNPGVVHGGTRVNVIAADAWAAVDVRIARMRDAARVERMFHALRPENRACTVKVSGGVNRPPMERRAGTVKLFRQAKKLAREIGFQLEEAGTGGGSDGNFTAALGVPTLDGMGAVGEGAHATHESILLEALAPRTALLAAMIAKAEA